MFESRRKLLHKILLGEDLFLECKEVRFSGRLVAEPKRDRLADDLAAFANDRGGILVLGVEDGTREILGIPLDLLDIVEEFVHELCFDNVKPPLAAAIERLTLPDSAGEEVAVIKIDVPSSLLVHSSPGGYLYRVGSTRRFMSPEYLARLFEQRSEKVSVRGVYTRAKMEHLHRLNRRTQLGIDSRSLCLGRKRTMVDTGSGCSQSG